MIREQIRRDIEKQVGRIVGKWDGRVEVIRTTDARFGDYTTNVALRFSHEVKQTPMKFAKVLADSLKNLPYIKKLEVKEPGFINFWVSDEYWQKQVEVVLKESKHYGSNQIGRGKKARVEFISANPTGPLHFGNARGGPIGDTLASVLEFCGYEVLREYLHNDVGVQVAKLGKSIVNVANGAKLEDQEYKGKYIRDLALKIANSKLQTQNSKLQIEEAGKRAVEILLKDILKDAQDMGIRFDKVYPESEFVTAEDTEKALKTLKEKGFLKEKDGALWFAPNDKFLADRECVVKKSDGAYTYFANDIAYHNLKFAEGYDLVIDILGANHHGHVPRLKAAVDALGFDSSKFQVILYQWVRFKKGRETVTMAKRAGTFVTAREVLDEIGRDALRFFILAHDANSHIDFDLDLAREKSAKNPVYYVQYAHARIASILRRANSKLQAPNSKINYQLLTTNYELSLIKQITKLPELVEEIAQNFAVHRLTSYVIELADSFHKFYENCPVLTSEKELKKARLSLICACQIALANTLALLGVSAPEKM